VTREELGGGATLTKRRCGELDSGPTAWKWWWCGALDSAVGCGVRLNITGWK
jgi:hypothetical protein